MAKKKNNKKNDSLNLPEYCDFSCEHADFTEPNASGACRKELTVWCSYFKRYNNKHNKCLGRN